jgi:hypothetical protein
LSEGSRDGKCCDAQQVTAVAFYSAYPNASVREIWKALTTKQAFDALLDTAAL